MAAKAVSGSHAIKWALELGSKRTLSPIILTYDIPKEASLEKRVKARVLAQLGAMSDENFTVVNRALEGFDVTSRVIKQEQIDKETSAFVERWSKEFAGHKVYKDKLSYGSELYLRVDKALGTWFVDAEGKLTVQNVDRFLTTHGQVDQQDARRVIVEEMSKLFAQAEEDVVAHEQPANKERVEKKALPKAATALNKAASA